MAPSPRWAAAAGAAGPGAAPAATMAAPWSSSPAASRAACAPAAAGRRWVGDGAAGWPAAGRTASGRAALRGASAPGAAARATGGGAAAAAAAAAATGLSGAAWQRRAGGLFAPRRPLVCSPRRLPGRARARAVVARRAFRVSIHAVGKPAGGGWEAAAVSEYTARLAAGALPVKVESTFHKTDQQLSRAIDRASGSVLVLDERGASLTSEEFARLVYARLEASGSTLAFAIGGADGLPAELRRLPPAAPGRPGAGRELLCLGRLTLPHRLVRVLLVEQLYRAQEIQRGSAYHRGDPLLK